jgi:ADP-heptose:LPS heptosyltransferase
MKDKIKILVRTLFRFLYFKIVRLIDIALNSRKPPFPLENVGTILLVEVQDIGDTIIASPCIRQIRKRFPTAEVHMLVQDKSLDVVQHNPNLDKVFGVANISSYRRLFQVSKEYRKRNYDLVISLSPSVRNNLIAVLSGGKIISGYLNDSFFLPTNYHDQPVETRGLPHPVEVTWLKEEPLIMRALKAAAPFGIDLTDCVDTELFLSDETVLFSENFLNRHKVLPSTLLIGVHPVTLNEFRNWPLKFFAELGDLFVEHFATSRIFLIGSVHDRDALDTVVSLMKHQDKVICDTSLSILETASVINHCDILVGTDSCPSDISGALGIPTVHMHGPTDPRVTGPGGQKNFPVVSGLPCSPCGLNVQSCSHMKKCMTQIDVSMVFDAALRAIKMYRLEKLEQIFAY